MAKTQANFISAIHSWLFHLLLKAQDCCQDFQQSRYSVWVDLTHTALEIHPLASGL
jgi:hypothetical protein